MLVGFALDGNIQTPEEEVQSRASFIYMNDISGNSNNDSNRSHDKQNTDVLNLTPSVKSDGGQIYLNVVAVA